MKYDQIIQIIKNSPEEIRDIDNLHLKKGIPRSTFRVLLNEGKISCCLKTGVLTVK